MREGEGRGNVLICRVGGEVEGCGHAKNA
jgi:hypothetical protein